MTVIKQRKSLLFRPECLSSKCYIQLILELILLVVSCNYWCISYRWKVIEQCSFSWDFPADAKYLRFWGYRPQKINFHHSDPQKALLWTKPRRLSHRALKLDAWFGLWSRGRKKYKNL